MANEMSAKCERCGASKAYVPHNGPPFHADVEDCFDHLWAENAKLALRIVEKNKENSELLTKIWKEQAARVIERVLLDRAAAVARAAIGMHGDPCSASEPRACGALAGAYDLLADLAMNQTDVNSLPAINTPVAPQEPASQPIPKP